MCRHAAPAVAANPTAHEAPRRNPGGFTLCANALALPLRDNSVDLIVTSPPFQAPFLDAAKIEMRRVLRPERPALVLEMRVRPAMWWWNGDRVIRPGRVLPPETVPGWQRLPEDDVAELIEAYSEPGERVCDPFCGSNVVARVAGKMGRVGIGLDIAWPERTSMFHGERRFTDLNA